MTRCGGLLIAYAGILYLLLALPRLSMLDVTLVFVLWGIGWSLSRPKQYRICPHCSREGSQDDAGGEC
jgi:hypothetical protein